MPRRHTPFDRETYEDRAGASLARTAWYKPSLRPLGHRGHALVVKDYAPCPLPWRLLFGRAMVARETAVYAALDGLPGIPRYRGRLDAYAFAVERVDGRDVSEYSRGTLPEIVVPRLYEVVRGMHDRGVVHGDLRQRKNVIVGPGEQPFLIDFETAFRLPPGSWPLRWLGLPDLSGVAKLRARHHPGLLTEEDRGYLALQRLRPGRALREARRRSRRRRAGRPVFFD